MTAVALHKGNVFWELSGWRPSTSPRSSRSIFERASRESDVRERLPSLPYERILREWGELGYKDDVMEGIFHGNAERVLGCNTYYE